MLHPFACPRSALVIQRRRIVRVSLPYVDPERRNAVTGLLDLLRWESSEYPKFFGMKVHPCQKSLLVSSASGWDLLSEFEDGGPAIIDLMF